MTIRLFGRLRRREFIRAFLIGLAAPFFANTAGNSQNYSSLEKSALAKPSATNLTTLENQKLGTADWELTDPAIKREIEGYAFLTSVNRGDVIKLFVNTNEPNYTIDIFRMGWYNGLGGRRMNDLIIRKGIKQSPPQEDEASGLIECHWQDPYILQIPDRTIEHRA